MQMICFLGCGYYKKFRIKVVNATAIRAYDEIHKKADCGE